MKPTAAQIALAESHGWRHEFIHGNGVDDYVWVHPTNGKAYAEGSPMPDFPVPFAPTHRHSPPQRRTTAARPNDRVTDNRAAFHHHLETVRSATRRTHLDEPTTDARVNA